LAAVVVTAEVVTVMLDVVVLVLVLLQDEVINAVPIKLAAKKKASPESRILFFTLLTPYLIKLRLYQVVTLELSPWNVLSCWFTSL
jgi:hypothetical protein